MALKRKGGGGGGGANWMDTYGDMVTLLLCFFVMLYAMSSVDQNRWIALVQALNPDAVVASGSEVDVPPDGSVVSQESIDQEIEQLFESMQSYIQSANMTGQVSIGRGNGYVFISFDELLPSAREYGEHHLSIYGLIAGMFVMAVSLWLFL